MVYWLVLIVYGIGTGGFTVTTNVVHVGNFSDLRSCQAVVKRIAGRRISGQLAIQLYLRSIVRR